MTPPLDEHAALGLLRDLQPGWEIRDTTTLTRRFRFPDFASAFARLGRIAEVAEQEGHHPDCCVGWGYLSVDITTHAIHALSRNDFILAAKIDALD